MNKYYYKENNGLLVHEKNDKLTLHREDGPAVIVYYENGKIFSEDWYLEGKYYRKGGWPYSTRYSLEGVKFFERFLDEYPTFDGGANFRSCYKGSGKVDTLQWYNEKSQLHREDGPAMMVFNEDGSIQEEKWYLEDREIKG